jgi:transposase
MDNAAIHKAKILKPLFSKLNIFYSAPYSPFLNPIEEFFSLLKRKVRTCVHEGRRTLIENIHKQCLLI